MKFKYLFCFLSFVIVISLFISSTFAANLDCNSIVSSECSSNYSSISNNSFKQDNKFIMDNNFKISESNCVNNSKDTSYNSKKLKSSAKKDTDFVDNVNDNISIVLDDSKSNINLDDNSEVNYDDGDSLNRNNYDTFGGRCFEYGKGKRISWGAEGFLVYGTNVMEDNA